MALGRLKRINTWLARSAVLTSHMPISQIKATVAISHMAIHTPNDGLPSSLRRAAPLTIFVEALGDGWPLSANGWPNTAAIGCATIFDAWIHLERVRELVLAICLPPDCGNVKDVWVQLQEWQQTVLNTTAARSRWASRCDSRSSCQRSSGKSFLSRDPTAVVFLWQEHLEFHHDAHRDPAAVVFLIALQAT